LWKLEFSGIDQRLAVVRQYGDAILSVPARLRDNRLFRSLRPEILNLLPSALEGRQGGLKLQRNPCLDQALLRTAIADLIMKIASRGESDPQKIKALALAAFRSHCYGPSKGEPPNRLHSIQ
jgi:hypothetical protein